MTTSTSEQISTATKENAETAINNGKIVAEALTERRNTAFDGLRELTKAYQDVAASNAERLKTSFQALAAVKTPTEFFEVQQKLINESLEQAIQDGKHITELTTAIFTAALSSVSKPIEGLQGPVTH